MRAGKYKRLPDFIEDRRMDTIALALDIQHLVALQHQYHLRGEVVQAAKIAREIDEKAKQIQRLQREIRRMATGDE